MTTFLGKIEGIGELSTDGQIGHVIGPSSREAGGAS